MIHADDSLGIRSAEPTVCEFEDVAVIELYGPLTVGSLLQLRLVAAGLAELREVNAVVLAIDCREAAVVSCGAMVALAELRRRKPLAAFLRNAAGLALPLALVADDLYARPDARLGPLGLDAAARVAHALRPAVPLERWQRLVGTSLSGEQAEAGGIVDRLELDEVLIVKRWGAL